MASFFLSKSFLRIASREAVRRGQGRAGQSRGAPEREARGGARKGCLGTWGKRARTGPPHKGPGGSGGPRGQAGGAKEPGGQSKNAQK